MYIDHASRRNPSFKILIAALRSRSCVCPHTGHVHFLTERSFVPLHRPWQLQQSCEDCNSCFALRGQAPFNPLFRLPSSVTLSLGRSSPERAFLAYLSTKDFPQSLQRTRPTPARVFPFFLTSIEPQAGQQQSVSESVSGVSESVSGLVTDTLFRPLDTLKRPCSHL